VFAKSVRVHVKAIRVLAGALKYQCRPCECRRDHESPVEAVRVLIKAVRVPIEIVGEPKEAAIVYNTPTDSTTLSQL